jgi:hypothetical protein
MMAHPHATAAHTRDARDARNASETSHCIRGKHCGDFVADVDDADARALRRDQDWRDVPADKREHELHACIAGWQAHRASDARQLYTLT